MKVVYLMYKKDINLKKIEKEDWLAVSAEDQRKSETHFKRQLEDGEVALMARGITEDGFNIKCIKFFKKIGKPPKVLIRRVEKLENGYKFWQYCGRVIIKGKTVYTGYWPIAPLKEEVLRVYYMLKGKAHV